MTIKIYNKDDVFVTMYESGAVPNVGDKLCLFLGGIDNRYCKGTVIERLFGKDCVALTIDSEDKPLSNYEIEADGYQWLDEYDDW